MAEIGEVYEWRGKEIEIVKINQGGRYPFIFIYREKEQWEADALMDLRSCRKIKNADGKGVLQLEVGKKYKTSCGKEVFIYYKKSCKEFPYKGLLVGEPFSGTLDFGLDGSGVLYDLVSQ